MDNFNISYVPGFPKILGFSSAKRDPPHDVSTVNVQKWIVNMAILGIEKFAAW